MTNLEEIRRFDKRRKRRRKTKFASKSKPLSGQKERGSCCSKQHERLRGRSGAAHKKHYQQNSGNAPHDGAGRIEHLLRLSAVVGKP